LLEASCGRRPIDLQDARGDIFLIDWVYGYWKRGKILNASDPKLEGSYVSEEMDLVLKLGMLCAHPEAEARPTMRQVAHFLERDAAVPEYLLTLTRSKWFPFRGLANIIFITAIFICSSFPRSLV